MHDSLTRRQFLERAAVMIPLLHPALSAATWGALPASAASTPLKPVTFTRLRMRTRRLEEMERFYTGQLSLPQVQGAGDSAVFRAGGTELEFVQVPEGPDPVYHFAFNIPENKLRAAEDWLAPRCPIVRRPDGTTLVYDFHRINAHAFYFLDPSGNILEFIARHNLKNAASGTFSPKDILYASEIGLVVPDVPRAVEDLHARLGLSVLSDPTPVFTMVGDEHGMFIVVKTGRIWLGSPVPAAPFVTEVYLRGSGAARIELPDAPFHVELRK